MTKKQIALSSFALLIISIVALQYAFISNNSIVLNSKVGNINLGKKTKKEAINILNSQQQQIKIVHKDGEESVEAKSTGIYIDSQKTVNNLPIITTKEKFVPLLPIIKSLKNNQNNQIVYYIDEPKLNEYSKELSNKLSKPPIDASAKIENNQIVINPESVGIIYEESEVSSKIKSQLFKNNAVNLEPKIVEPNVKSEKLKTLNEKLDKLKNQQLTLTIESINQVIPTEQLINSLEIKSEKDAYLFSINKDKILPIITEINQKYSVPAGVTQVKLVDDTEVSRQNGQPGKTINNTEALNSLEEWVNNPATNTIALKTVALSPKIVYQKKYSKSSVQLQEKINAWIASHRGSYQVAVVELGGQGREASYNVMQQTVMASTYKTFLAFTAYKLAESGSLDLNAQLFNGKNIEQCIATMIINSDNDCAIALGRKIGWARADQIIRSSGFNNVKLNNYDSAGNLNSDKMVNAKEQANFIAQLSAGSLINSNNTSKLMGYMKKQVYRQGIPAGSRGAVVADKVGFLDNYLHDVGVVYGSKSTYALVIMSEGSSWANISNLAQAIYDFMN